MTPKQALNKAWLKKPVQRTDLDLFKTELNYLRKHTNAVESEEFHKNLVSDFLKRAFYRGSYFINTKGRNDLVIHMGPQPQDFVGVIIEAKKPTNKGEMPTATSLDCRAIQELVLYYLRERHLAKNLEVKHLVCTNINHWFVFDAVTFDRLFAQDVVLTKRFLDFDKGVLADTTTAFFYKEIASPAIRAVEAEMLYTFFDVREYEEDLADATDAATLVELFKLLSPEHLLKLPFSNDSNSLDKGFYTELLHIIGLKEILKGGKPLIVRKDEAERDPGSLIENAIVQIDSLDKMDRLKVAGAFGKNREEQIFNVAVELSITWINRILFLKLLEAQLIAFHKGDSKFQFMNTAKLQNFDDLDVLFFQVLARRPPERSSAVAVQFPGVPYLNSSLFEPSELEHQMLTVSGLADGKTIRVLRSTVLKAAGGERISGTLPALAYTLKFLSAFNFAADGVGQIQDDDKRLINASVLGLIFEKINGYRDGAFFTPGYVTMRMAKTVIRRAIVQKFNAQKNWTCTSIEDIYGNLELKDRAEANVIVNSLRICDPAVGSGHFLVSVLNEIISIKSELRILSDRSGARLKEYTFEVIDDELVVSDEDGRIHEYRPGSKESQRVQEALFEEKQLIIENCLFGVDINSNSVKICRLRLWIELLKNAYYDPKTGFLETLPNIDINIKHGNSVVSRFSINEDLKQALKKSGHSLTAYRQAVARYRNARDKTEKREMEELIESIKAGFRTEIMSNDPKIRRLGSLRDDYNSLRGQTTLFEETAAEKKARVQQLATLSTAIDKLHKQVETIRSNQIYVGAFEWRFEFPEVLDDQGKFLGFDVVIANPPYIDSEKMVRDGHADIRAHLGEVYTAAKGNWDLYIIFLELGLKLLRSPGNMTFITPDKWLSKPFGDAFRTEHIDKIWQITVLGRGVFEHALVDSIVTDLCTVATSGIDTYLLEHGEASALNSAVKADLPEPHYLDPLLSRNYEFVKKIDLLPDRLGDMVGCESACSTADAYKIKPLVKELTGGFDPVKSFRMINTGTIGRYASRWSTKPMTYLKAKYSMPVVDRAAFAKAFPNSYGGKAGMKKIILKGLNLLDASLDLDGTVIPGKTTLILPSEDGETLKYAAAILHCPLAIFYIKSRYGSSSYNGGINFSKGMINALPIPTNPDQQKQIVDLVDEILSRRVVDPTVDIRDLEEKINAKLYALYKLTDAEIELVELVATNVPSAEALAKEDAVE